MNTLFRFFSLLLCFELALSPLGQSLVVNSSSAQTTCPPGQKLNTARNMCETSQDVINANAGLERCRQLSSKEAQQKCFEQEGKNQLEASSAPKIDKAAMDKDGKTNWKNWRTNVTAGAALGIPLFFLVQTMIKNREFRKASGAKNIKCNPISLTLMYGGAAALALSEIITLITHGKKLEENKERWDEIVAPDPNASVDKQRTQATNAQSQAFEMLAENEESIKNVANTKKGFYLASASIFGASALAATFEQIQIGAARKKYEAATKLVASPDPAIAREAYLTIQRETATINKLTCYTSDQDINRQMIGANGVAEKDGEIKAINDENARKVKEAEQKKTVDDIAEKYGLTKPSQLRFQSKLPSDFNGGGSTTNKFKLNNSGDKKLFVPKSINSKGITPVYGPGGQQYKSFQPNKNGGGTTYFLPQALPREIIQLQNRRLQQSALKNIATADSLSDLHALLEEYESIDFETYSTGHKNQAEMDLFGDAHTKLDPLAMKIISQMLLIENGFAQTENKDGMTLPEVVVTGTRKIKTKNKFISFLENTGSSLWKKLEKISDTFKFKNGEKITSEELGKIKEVMTSKFNKAIYQPYSRIAISGVLGGWMGYMTAHMDDTADAARDRAAKLREIKLSFETHAGLMFCKEEDRKNTEKPECYCYTPDNKPNPARAKSKICANAYAAYNKNNMNYLNIPEIRGCLSANGNVDLACNCRQTRSCMKVSGFEMNGMSPGTFKMLSGAMAPVNDLFSGNMTGSRITTGAGINAARIRKSASDLLKQADPVAAKEVASLEATMARDLASVGSGLTMGSASDSSPMPITPQQAAAALEKELDEAKTEDLSVADGAGGEISTPGAQPEPEFGLSEEGLAVQESQVAEVMKQDLDYGDNDINKGSSVNIFEALTNRYQRSGMKRLFDENSSGPVEAPSDKEIQD